MRELVPSPDDGVPDTTGDHDISDGGERRGRLHMV
jgi:hypothetical protein